MGRLKQRYSYAIILLKQLVRTDFKLRYQGSFLGYIWSLLRPLALFAILYVVFVKFLPVGKGVPYFPVYLLLGIVLWNFFVEVTNGSVASIVARGDLLRKLNFPKYVIVLAGSVSALINLLINFIVVAVFMVFNHVHLHFHAVLLPLLVAELFLIALSLAFYLSALFVRFRDVGYIWEVLMQGAFYATPIIYPVSRIPAQYAKILLLNPVAQIIQDARYILITEKTQTIQTLYGSAWIRLVPLSFILFITFFSAWYFKKHSANFAEEV